MPAPVRSRFDRPRWTEADARVVLGELDRSGKPVRVFAEEHGLDPQRLYSWRRRFTAVAGGDNTRFRELIVRPSSEISGQDVDDSRFEIVLASGVVVRVPSKFDAAALARLLDVLSQARAC
jgi:transposase-like protein